MTFDEILTQVLALLQREKRVSYRALKRRFDFDDGSCYRFALYGFTPAAQTHSD